LADHHAFGGRHHANRHHCTVREAFCGQSADESTVGELIDGGVAFSEC
jgi:hypothetical protein